MTANESPETDSDAAPRVPHHQAPIIPLPAYDPMAAKLAAGLPGLDRHPSIAREEEE